jgi:hypothetical protein
MDQPIAPQDDPNVLVVPEDSALILIEPAHRNGAQHSQTTWRQVMTSIDSSEAAKAVVRRNTEEVQISGNFEVFDELFADDFLATRHSRAARLIRRARDSSTKASGPHSQTFAPISIGKLPMSTA